MGTRAWAKYGSGVAVCLLFGWFTFIRGKRIPLLGGVDLGFHELGHLLTYPFPELFTAVMGSVTQVLVPLGLAAYFAWKHRDLLGVGLCLAWAGASAWDVSVYVSDAPYQLLPLIGGEHDWAFILERLDMLDQADGIAGAVKAFGFLLVLFGATVCGAGPFIEERRKRKRESERTPEQPPEGGWAIVPPWEEGR